jgi:hypothetical protein
LIFETAGILLKHLLAAGNFYFIILVKNMMIKAAVKCATTAATLKQKIDAKAEAVMALAIGSKR